MPEYDNDRLEQFFRKAASKPEVTFNEEDWKKLEARLDAEKTGLSNSKKTGSRIITAVGVVLILVFSGAVWMYDSPDESGVSSVISDAQIAEGGTRENADGSSVIPADDLAPRQQDDDQHSDNEQRVNLKDEANNGPGATASAPGNETSQQDQIARTVETAEKEEEHARFPTKIEEQVINTIAGKRNNSFADDLTDPLITTNGLPPTMQGVAGYDEEKIFNDLVRTSQISTAFAEKIKQEAVVELPGAEEETRGAEAVVREEHASEQQKHESLSRLSLLLSFAPDYSSTSYKRYTTAGNAFGMMIHYHVRNRWSVAVGAIKSFKKYTGEGEDYQPPKGYWKYYTNGVIPESIDGSCNVLEFPVLVQYTIAANRKSRWTASVGASSYLMLNESYRYNFEQPNPGAKDGWDSRSSSRFLFNMANFAVGYERQLFPRMMIGIEPYAKVPLEKIGWSNLKLFSTGASVTVRYTLIRRQTNSLSAQGRGPD
jgi:hypothetical protein